MRYLIRMAHEAMSTRLHPRQVGLWYRARVAVVVSCMLLLLAPTRMRAHEIPQRVAIRGFVVRDSAALRLLVRVPLEAMRDVDFPLRPDGSLDLVRVRPLLAEAAQVWLVNAIRVTADGETLVGARISGARVSLPNDRSFESVAAASASFGRAPLADEMVQWQQVLLDVVLDYPLPRGAGRLVLHPDLATLGIRTTSVWSIVRADGTARMLVYDGNPEAVELDPAWYQTGGRFLRLGFQHILGGIDHLLFVFCLVLAVRRWQSVVAIVSAFTVAHSITLAAAATGMTPTALWFPPLVETLIAASIVWLALENVLLDGSRLERRWPVAFAFGLIHGFGFAFALGESLQFAGGNLVSALLAFNIGVEAGQLAALSLAVPVLWLVRRQVGKGRERLVTIVFSAVVAHEAWHWMTGRGAALAAYRGSLAWPAFDAALALQGVRLALLAAVALAAALALRQILRVTRLS
jgi:HupE / UreJ protein